jgi:hypothetical protein
MAYTRTPNSIIAGVGLLQTPNPAPLTPSGILPVILDAKIASTTSLGVVQIGNNIQVTPEGVISVKDSHKCKRATKVISENYTAFESDYYIGVDSTKAVVVTLPSTPHAGTELIIKVEMKPPVGSRKVTIKTSDGSLIDGASSVVLQQSYEVVTLIYRNNWYKI